MKMTTTASDWWRDDANTRQRHHSSEPQPTHCHLHVNSLTTRFTQIGRTSQTLVMTASHSWYRRTNQDLAKFQAQITQWATVDLYKRSRWIIVTVIVIVPRRPMLVTDVWTYFVLDQRRKAGPTRSARDRPCSSSSVSIRPETRRQSGATVRSPRGRPPARRAGLPRLGGGVNPTTDCGEPYDAFWSPCRSNPTNSGHGLASVALNSYSSSSNNSLSSCRHGNSYKAPGYH